MMTTSTKDQSPYETYGEYLARKLCDNSAKRGMKTGITPRCFDGKRQHKCIVYYDSTAFLINNKSSPISTTTMTLCTPCMRLLKKDCRKRKYRIRTTRLEIK